MKKSHIPLAFRGGEMGFGIEERGWLELEAGAEAEHAWCTPIALEGGQIVGLAINASLNVEGVEDVGTGGKHIHSQQLRNHSVPSDCGIEQVI